MGGLYDLLETYRIQNDPRFAYEGLYQDPLREDQLNYYNNFRELKLPYDVTDVKRGLQPLMSSAFPQEFGVGSLFDPRVGRPEQSIYYNEPEPADPTSDFYQPLPGFINAPQNYYPAIRAMQPEPTSLGFDTSYGVANEEDEEQVEYLPGQEPQGIAKLFQKIGDIYRNLPTPMNILRGGLQSLQGFNQRIRNTDFGQSRTLQEYFERKRQRDQAKRAQEAMPGVYESAREQGFTNDRGGFSTTSADKAGTSLGSGQFSPSTSRGRSGY